MTVILSRPQLIKLIYMYKKEYTDGSVQDCNVSIANALEILIQSFSPMICQINGASLFSFIILIVFFLG